MKVTLITAVWQRQALTEVFWRWTAHLRDWWGDIADVALVAVGSDDPIHERLAAQAGAIYGDVPNTPLGRKWNAALKLARQTKPDAVLVMGSDDVFCASTAAAYRRYLANFPFTGLADFYYYHTLDGRAGYFPGYRRPERAGEPSGSGRLIPAEFLQRLGWELWNPKPWFRKHAGYRRGLKNHGVDHYSFQRLKLVTDHPPCILLRTIDGTAVSLKGQGNLWQFEHTHPRPLPNGETTEQMLERLPADVLAGIRALRPAEVA